MDPFQIEGPAVISFSGGRTSGYMLRRVLDAGLAPDVFVVFADTGKERAETYEFVDRIEREWSVPLNRVMRPGGFEQLITEKKYLPNPITRFCTQELKVNQIKKFMQGKGFEHWTNVVGIRADEPMRVARMRNQQNVPWDNHLPLAMAGVTERDVLAFWDAQSFNLGLNPWESNCDLCFLKGRAIKERIIREQPHLADWWIEQERRIGGTFRNDSPTYAQMKRHTKQQPEMFCGVPASEDDLGDCVCHD